MGRSKEFFVIRDEATGKFYNEEDGGGGPGPYTIREWVNDVYDATRFDIYEELDKDGYYKNQSAQVFIHEDCFKMPPTARIIRVRITEKIVDVVEVV